MELGTWECKEIGWRLLGLLHRLDEVGGRQRWPSRQDGIYDEDEENPLKYKPDCDGDGIENRLDPNPCPFFEPQGISPNGDGKNDVLVFEGLLTKPIPNHISIFDRVGSLVYETDNYQNNWAGETSKGTSLFEKTG